MTLGRCPLSIFCSRGTPPPSQPPNPTPKTENPKHDTRFWSGTSTTGSPRIGTTSSPTSSRARCAHPDEEMLAVYIYIYIYAVYIYIYIYIFKYIYLNSLFQVALHLPSYLWQVFCHAASKPALLKECVRVLKVDPPRATVGS